MANPTNHVIGVLLSGGEGKRLWPLSTHFHPKQFLKLGGDHALLVESIKRNEPFVDEFIAVTNKRYQYLIQRDFRASTRKPFRAIYEFEGRNTAPAIALATLTCNPDDILIAAPTDAKIKDLDLYAQAMEEAIAFAEQGFICTFGIAPTSPHTGYGYIHYQGNDILDFTEKPSVEVAETYLASGDYLWNSGIFVFRASTMAHEPERFRPDIYHTCQAAIDNAHEAAERSIAALDEQGDTVRALVAYAALGNVEVSKEDTAAIPSESIDYAVIEKSMRLKVVPAVFYWSDLGSIEALAQQFDRDEHRNRISGENVVLSDCNNTSVINDGANNLVVAVGVDDLVIANTNNVVYISREGESEKIKEVVAEKIDDLHDFVEENLWSERPWGFYEVLLNTPHYKIKRLTVEPGMRLSFQAHEHRTEYWVATVGEGIATIGDRQVPIATPQCLEIPAHMPHRIANNTDETLRIIEVSSGKGVRQKVGPLLGGPQPIEWPRRGREEGAACTRKEIRCAMSR